MTDRAGAQKVVARPARRHPGAAHVCWALLAGGQSAAVDDGEPSGTAGRPMLDVLRHQDLEGVLATVVRYFGGVKLGAGGLVRAYTDSVAQALLKADKIAIIRQRTPALRGAPYPLEGLVRRELELAGAALEQVEHRQDVLFTFSLPDDKADALACPPERSLQRADRLDRINRTGLISARPRAGCPPASLHRFTRIYL
jgi:putative IMPACT (imprinted ancient) family translation regulator